MYQIKETIVVEGVYDKIRLSRFIDGVIFVAGGFSVMHDEKKLAALRSLAEKTGIVIFTDADSAGFRIRNFLKQQVPPEQVKHAYIPDIKGKEKRKDKPGKEGLLGVEGVEDKILLQALKNAGCTIDGDFIQKSKSRKITKTDFYAAGLAGGADSAAGRAALASRLGLPMKISANMLLDVVNQLLDYEEYCEIVQNIQEDME